MCRIFIVVLFFMFRQMTSMAQISVVECYAGNRDDLLINTNSVDLYSTKQAPLRINDSFFLQLIISRSTDGVFSQNSDTTLGHAYLICLDNKDITQWIQPLDSFDIPSILLGNGDSIFISSLNFNSNRKIVGQWWNIHGYSISPLYIYKDIDTLQDSSYWYEYGYMISCKKNNDIFLRCIYAHLLFNWYPYIYYYNELLKISGNQIATESSYSAVDNAYFPDTKYNVDISYGICTLINDNLGSISTHDFIRPMQMYGITSPYFWTIEEYDYMDTSTTLSWINLNNSIQIEETFKHTHAYSKDSVLILLKNDTIRIANNRYPLQFYSEIPLPYDSVNNIKVLYSDQNYSLFVLSYIENGINYNSLMNTNNIYIELSADQFNSFNSDNYQYFKELNLLLYFSNTSDSSYQYFFNIYAMNSETLSDSLIWSTKSYNYYARGSAFYTTPYVYFNLNINSDSCNGLLDDVLFLKWKISDISTGVKLQKDESYFTLYPNPASTILYLNFKEHQNEGVLSVIDINGKMLYDKRIQQPQEIIHTTDWTNGIYLLRYQTKGNIQTEKLVIQH